MKAADQARVTTFVAVAPDDAFEVFTKETNLWWRHGPRYRFGTQKVGVIRFEGELGGRLVEVFEDNSEDSFEVGKILVWEPGERLMFEWHGRNFAVGERTEVEVRFESVEGGTRVVLEHRGWDSLPAKHPARHGLTGNAFIDMIGLWWGDLATALRIYIKNDR